MNQMFQSQQKHQSGGAALLLHQHSSALPNVTRSQLPML
jgi:hypothetical protein